MPDPVVQKAYSMTVNVVDQNGRTHTFSIASNDETLSESVLGSIGELVDALPEAVVSKTTMM